jgi:hypothetical protein
MREAKGLRAIAIAGVLLAAGSAVAADPVEGEKSAPAAPAAAAPVVRKWRPLRSAAATATSFLQNNWNRYEENYHPNYVLDDNPATAWVEGADGFGEDESITLPLSPIRNARALRLRIWNGYQKSLHLWTKNAMPQILDVAVLGPQEHEITKVSESLEKIQGPQEFVIELPKGRVLAGVRFTIRAVYEGEKYDDTCISDIDVDVDADARYNATAEKAKAAALASWISERKAVAAYFAAKPREFPFAFTTFVGAKSTIDKAELKKKLAARDALVASLPPDRFRVASKGLRALPDGLGDEELHLGDFADLIKLDAMTLRESKDEIAKHVESYSGLRNVWTTSARVARDADGKKDIHVVAFGIKDVTTERTTETKARDLVLVYGQQGRLETVYRTVVEDSGETEEGDDGETRTDEIWSLSYDDAGKVRSVEREALGHSRKVTEKGLGRERENRRATRVVYQGVVDKSS